MPLAFNVKEALQVFVSGEGTISKIRHFSVTASEVSKEDPKTAVGAIGSGVVWDVQ